MLQKMRKNEKGFTLIELMIVIAIIGILSAIAIPNFLKYRDKGIKGGLTTEAKSFYSAAVAYISDTGTTNNLQVSDDSFGYDQDSKFTSDGSISADPNGVLSGEATFSYKGHISTVNELGTVTVD